MGSSNSSHVGKKLGAYRKKRAAGRTPEPFGASSAAPPTKRFVVQKHDATRLHYDFRLEHEGVLLSWAVPKGPSADPSEKRLAVQVEDHPVEYAGFEGTIPDDNYGAGPVIVWDQGAWVALQDPDEGLKKGKLLFELHGWKMRGVWTLVRTRRRGQRDSKEWLLIKHRDRWAGSDAPFAEESVLSGLTVEELGPGRQGGKAIAEELAQLGAPRAAVAIDGFQPMLAEQRDQPFSDPAWLFELKYDGFRLLAAREAGRARLQYRSGLDATAIFPDVARALEALPVESLLLDGEVVVHDESSRPSFERLLARAQLSRPADLERAAVEQPAVLYAFDLIGFEGFDLRGLPLATRKRLLERLLPRLGSLRYADHVEGEGVAMFDEVRKMKLEGLVAKRAASPYQSRRSNDWLKVREAAIGDFVVVGYSPPKRGRVGVGALHLAGRDEAGGLAYVSAVGSGFSDDELRSVRARLDRHQVAEPPFSGAPLGAGPHVWCRPQWVCEVRFQAWTSERRLRGPVFLRFRDDKRPEECDPIPSREVAGDRPPPPPPPASVDRSVKLTNLDKLFWPGEGYTKGDLIEFYRAVAPWLLVHLRDRPLVLTRYPDGIEGKSFFQKNAPAFVPSWLRTERMWSEQREREIDYFVCDDLETLVYLVNLGTIPLHVWASRVATLERPDWLVLDLDPKGAPFSHVVEVALAIRRLCDEIELPSYVKTSGQAGLHVLVPLGRQCTFEQAKQIAQLLSRVIVARLPERATIERVIDQRGGRVYLDYVQNGHGRLLAAPLAVRPVAGALVSTPLEWRELTRRLDPTRFHIRSVPRRLSRLGDPIAPVVDEAPDLTRALAHLAERV